MRYLFGFIFVLALGVMGCGETADTGVTGGDGGQGGDGAGGDGGTGGTDLCEGVDCDDGNECTGDTCLDGTCENAPVENGAACGGDSGTCQEGSCRMACTEQGIRDAIAAGGGPYTFDCDGPTTITISKSLVAETDLILDGQGDLTLDGGGLGSNASLELRGLAFSNLKWAITVLGSLTLIDSRVTDSEQGAIRGGFQGLAIRNTIISGAGSTAIDFLGPGPGTIEYSTVEGSYRHGISNSDRVGCGPLTIRNTTVSGNGGYGLDLCGEVTVSNSTVSGNSDGVVVGSSDCEPRLRITNSTVFGGVRYVSACGDAYRGRIEARGALMIGGCRNDDEPPPPNGEAEWVSLGHNIESPGDTCGFDQPTDQVNVSADDLKLGPLQDNGGPTMTHALLPGSVAIDQIPAVDCEVTTDQRGFPRPAGTTDPKRCDVGAFEVQPEP